MVLRPSMKHLIFLPKNQSTESTARQSRRAQEGRDPHPVTGIPVVPSTRAEWALGECLWEGVAVPC